MLPMPNLTRHVELATRESWSSTNRSPSQLPTDPAAQALTRQGTWTPFRVGDLWVLRAGVVMVTVGIVAAVPVLIILIVFAYCWWLVRFTGKAESMREVAPVLRGLRDLVRPGHRR